MCVSLATLGAIGSAASGVAALMGVFDGGEGGGPAVEKPVAMPDPLAQEAKQRRKAALISAQQMTRASTVLTPTTEKLGG